MLEALAGELPEETIRFSSKVVHIELSGHYKMVHLSDGTILKTKVLNHLSSVNQLSDGSCYTIVGFLNDIQVLIGCDGVYSVVGKWLGFKNPASTARLAIRGLTHFPSGHEFGKRFFQFNGDGVRSGFIPCDHNTVYWFLTHTSTSIGKWNFTLYLQSRVHILYCY